MPPFTSIQAQPVIPGADTADAADTADWETWVLPSAAASAQSARRQIGDRLQAWGLQHLVDDAELIVSELLTNAICHGSQHDPVWHTLRRIRTPAGEAVRLEVGDYGRGWSRVPAPREAGDDIHCDGRGLYLVEALSSSWGAWRLPHGHVVWAVLPIDAELADSRAANGFVPRVHRDEAEL